VRAGRGRAGRNSEGNSYNESKRRSLVIPKNEETFSAAVGVSNSRCNGSRQECVGLGAHRRRQRVVGGEKKKKFRANFRLTDAANPSQSVRKPGDCNRRGDAASGVSDTRGSRAGNSLKGTPTHNYDWCLLNMMGEGEQYHSSLNSKGKNNKKETGETHSLETNVERQRRYLTDRSG